MAAVKPQSAFFERHGSAGIAVLEETLAALRDVGTLSVLDVKRGDIGSTMAGYAQAYLSDSAPLAADSITVSPYLGYGSLTPALDLAEASGRGIFVLALTSNPEGATVQHAVRGDQAVAAGVVEGVTASNASASGEGRLGSIGLVIGATVGESVSRLGIDLLRANGPLLAPGVSAQGALSEDKEEVTTENIELLQKVEGTSLLEAIEKALPQVTLKVSALLEKALPKTVESKTEFDIREFV